MALRAAYENTERFCLRILLLNVESPKSFEYLRTVNEILYPSFKTAAIAMGLFDNDEEWIRALEEAALFRMPSSLRRLFATILLFTEPGDIGALWTRFFSSLNEDISHEFPEISDELLLAKVADKVDVLLSSHGKNWSDFPGLPAYDRTLLQSSPDQHNRMLQEELSYDVDILDELSNRSDTLNLQQKNAFNEVIESINNVSKIFFVDGPGGSGKTYLYNTILGTVRKSGKIAIAVASSGIAATLLFGGRTAHSRFKINFDKFNCNCSVSRGSQLATLFKKTKLIIWDEAPMANKSNFEAVDKMLRDIIGNDQPFGGITVVFGGDFRQILPVVVKGNRAQILNSSLKKFYLWCQIKTLKLKNNMRLTDADVNFPKFLLDLGEGLIPKDVPIPLTMAASSLTDLISKTYINFDSHYHDLKYLAERAILASKNSIVDEINTQIIDLLDSDYRIFSSADTLIQSDGLNSSLYPQEFLNNLDLNGCPPHKLKLKKGCPIMLLRNLDASRGLCNGSRLIVTSLTQHIIVAKTLTNQMEVFIPRIDFIPQTDLPFEFRRRQFPVRVCYAMTINKSQGQSIPHVGLYLPEPVFTHGQLYVGFSRVTNSRNITVCAPNNVTKNIVYTEIFD
jgi:ATP-dependent DNA helicase PIF1